MPYATFRDAAAALLKVPVAPPPPPPGDHTMLTTFRASPDWLRYRITYVSAALAAQATGLVAGDLVLGTSLPAGGGWVSVLFAVLTVFAFAGLVFWTILRLALTRLDYELRHYLLTDRALRIREGAWTVREVTVTFANVQNVRTTQGPLMRLFGLWDLVIETAGGGTADEEPGAAATGHRAALRGLADPHGVRASILQRLRAEKGTGLGDPEEKSHAARAGAWGPRHLTLLREIAGDLSKLVGATPRHAPDR